MRRTLVLNKETLADLTPAEMRGVAGAALTPYCPIRTDHCVSLLDCLSRLMDPCPR